MIFIDFFDKLNNYIYISFLCLDLILCGFDKELIISIKVCGMYFWFVGGCKYISLNRVSP